MLRRNTSFAMASAAFRGGANAALIVLLARTLSVEEFGIFTFGLAAATIASLAVDYGFATLLLRDLSDRGESVAGRIGATTSGKLVLGAIAVVVLTPLTLWWDTLAGAGAVLLILFVGQACGTFGNLYLVPYKTRDRFDVEALWTGIEAIALLGGTAMAAMTTGEALLVAVAYTGARLVFAVGSLLAYRRRWSFQPTTDGMAGELKLGLPFAIHVFVGTAYLNIDTVIMRRFLSFDDIGIYQSAVRIVVLLSMFLSVVNSVLIPRLAALRLSRPDAFHGDAVRSVYAVSAIGLVCAAPMVLLPETVMHVLYGSEFTTGAGVLRIMGYVVAVRFAGAVYGILLTVSGRQELRSLAALATLIALALADVWAIPRFGLEGAARVLLAAHVGLVGVYAVATRLEHGRFFLVPPRAKPAGGAP